MADNSNMLFDIIFRENCNCFGLWEFRGSFGILNSGPSDVGSEVWHGYRLERKLLDLLMRQ